MIETCFLTIIDFISDYRQVWMPAVLILVMLFVVNELRSALMSADR